MQLEDLNLVAAASRPGQVAKSKPERETGSYSFPKGRDVLVVLPKDPQRDTVLERRDFVIVREDFKKALHRFTRELPRQCKYPV